MVCTVYYCRRYCNIVGYSILICSYGKSIETQIIQIIVREITGKIKKQTKPSRYLLGTIGVLNIATIVKIFTIINIYYKTRCLRVFNAIVILNMESIIYIC